MRPIHTASPSLTEVFLSKSREKEKPQSGMTRRMEKIDVASGESRAGRVITKLRDTFQRFVINRFISVEKAHHARANAVNRQLGVFLARFETGKDTTYDFNRLVDLAREEAGQTHFGISDGYLQVIARAFEDQWHHNDLEPEESVKRANKLLAVLNAKHAVKALNHRYVKENTFGKVLDKLYRGAARETEQVKKLIEDPETAAIEPTTYREFTRLNKAIQLIRSGKEFVVTEEKKAVDFTNAQEPGKKPQGAGPGSAGQLKAVSKDQQEYEAKQQIQNASIDLVNAVLTAKDLDMHSKNLEKLISVTIRINERESLVYPDWGRITASFEDRYTANGEPEKPEMALMKNILNRITNERVIRMMKSNDPLHASTSKALNMIGESVLFLLTDEKKQLHSSSKNEIELLNTVLRQVGKVY